MTVRSAAGDAQERATDPSFSTWLSANAGSGKTRVLIHRVVRLLFAGTPPQRILCLTFTKAAAAEMQNRLFRLLGEWTMREADDLRAALREIGIEGAIDPASLASARRLFAQAIEAPGGLRIQTIHAFCASLLRRFPVEARMSPDFREIDDATGAALQAEVLEAMADGPEQPVIDALAEAYPSDDWGDLINEIIRKRQEFSMPVEHAALLAELCVPSGTTPRTLAEAVFGLDGLRAISALVPLISNGNKTERAAVSRLTGIDPEADPLGAIEALEAVYFTEDGTVRKGDFPSVGARKGAAAALTPSLDALKDRTIAGRPVRLALVAAGRAVALHQFASAFLKRYAEAKTARAYLDFDDLIAGTSALLSDHSVAQWVLYRLDGGIDHILVDEAQDTSPGQWTVIERLTEEFSGARGARDEDRTIFVVGDKKQSIYSFQGADLQTFDRMEGVFRNRFLDRQPWQEVRLEHSFRSSPAILRVVDATFEAAAGAGLGGLPSHAAFHADMPGRVDLWPPETDEKVADERDYFVPRFVPDIQRAVNRLAQKIALHIRQLIDDGVPVRDGKGGYRAAHAGDVLVLVQRRSELSRAIITSCKAAGLEVAGTDRVKLHAELAVRDLTALLNFLALPEDDLSLATVLRSPMFGWSDARLFSLAARRPANSHLWAALRETGSGVAETVSVLTDLRDRADYLRPHDLIERALIRHGMRSALLARLGPEAEDGIDELLTQALKYEQTEIPSLTGFLLFLAASPGDVKRQTQQGARAIRVMTVHGAKGLEAPVVILPDTTSQKSGGRDEILHGSGGVPLWRTRMAETPPVMERLAADAKARQDQERMRLLYVAMTRAESWLIVAAAGDVGEDDGSWYTLIRKGMIGAGSAAVSNDSGEGEVLRHAFGHWPDLSPAQMSESDPELQSPGWLHTQAVPPDLHDRLLLPSDMPGAKTLPGEGGQDESAALRYGTQLHALLEHLPEVEPGARQATGRDLLESADDPATSAEIEAVLADALNLVENSALLPIFGKGSLTEVDITGRIPQIGNRLVHGTVDRLIVEEGRILAIDYKSNRVVPTAPEAVPAGIVRQMGVYAALLEQIYPDRPVEVAILWTADGSLMTLPRDMVMAGLLSTPIP